VICSKIALGVPTASAFDFGLKMRLLYRACYLLSHRCEDVLNGREKNVFSDPCIDDKRFSIALDFAALRMAGGYYRPPFLFVGWNLFGVSEFFERKKM